MTDGSRGEVTVDREALVAAMVAALGEAVAPMTEDDARALVERVVESLETGEE